MRLRKYVCVCILLILWITGSLAADWEPYDGHKMHFPQLPDTTGWDVDAEMNYTVLADDWMCSTTGPISEIYFWGSWFNGNTGTIDSLKIKILSDIPADPPSILFSRPGDILWEVKIESWQFYAESHWADTQEGYYIPSGNDVFENNHNEYWGYKIQLLDWMIEEDLFVQYQGTVYWLSIQAFSRDGMWGWKSSQDRWNDCAVYRDDFVDWTNMFEPTAYIDSLNLAFVINGEAPMGGCCYEYGNEVLCTEETQEECENFIGGIYLGYQTYCSGHVGACCLPDGTCINTDSMCCAVEYGGTFYGYTACGVDPGACCFPDGSCASMNYLCCVEAGGEFNPYESCLGDSDGDGNDDLCVEPIEEGACCFSDGSCLTTTETDCNNQGGNYEGDGTQCSGSIEACCLSDGGCLMADAYCCVEEFGGTPEGPGTECYDIGGCCLPDGSCTWMYLECCVDMGGDFIDGGCAEETGACCVDGSCVMVDRKCCTDIMYGTWIGGNCSEPQACCLPDGSCQNMDPACCSDWQYNGTPQGEGTSCSGQTMACCFQDGSCQNLDPLCCAFMGGTVSSSQSCLGDSNQNGIDDACESPCQGKCGDANNDDKVNVSDAVYVINFVFSGGNPPKPVLACGDSNTDGRVNVSDAVHLINFVFSGGNQPGNCSPGDEDWTDGDCCEFTL